jgi:exonuclease III
MSTLSIVSWNVNKRFAKLPQQAESLQALSCDVIALQEVTLNSIPSFEETLQKSGYQYSIDSLRTDTEKSVLKGKRAYGQMILSKYKIDKQNPIHFSVPWPERVLSGELTTPWGLLEIHTTHIPPGATNGWLKIEMFNGIYHRLAIKTDRMRILCGDFNSPQAETEAGEAITWGQKYRKDGTLYYKKDSGEEWDAGERSVLEKLADYDLRDVFRKVNGYKVEAYSWFTTQTKTGRRFDHIFASETLGAASCKYVMSLLERGYSDHAPIMATFRPVSNHV